MISIIEERGYPLKCSFGMGYLLLKIFTEVFLNLIMDQIWESLRKKTHSCTKFCILLGVIDIPEAEFASHACSTYLYHSFSTVLGVALASTYY